MFKRLDEDWATDELFDRVGSIIIVLSVSGLIDLVLYNIIRRFIL